MDTDGQTKTIADHSLMLAGRQTDKEVTQSVERRALEGEVRSSKPALGTWWWGRIPTNQSWSEGATPAVTTLLVEW